MLMLLLVLNPNVRNHASNILTTLMASTRR
jgi:hypothetical protein